MRFDSDTVTVTTAGTRVQVNNIKDSVLVITFTARVGNTGFIYVGVIDVSSTSGLELDAGDSVSVDFGDGSVLFDTLYVDSSVSGEKVDWVALIQ